MKDFIVDSKGRCFLCVNQTYLNPTSSSSSSIKSIQFLSRYLKMDMGLVFLENEPPPPELLAKVKKSELKVELCEECSALNKTFSLLCRQLERIEMEMKSCLNSFQSKLATAADKDFTTSGPLTVDDSSRMLGKLKIANVLRKEAMKKCSAKLKRAEPRVKLRNWSSKKILKERTKRKRKYHGHLNPKSALNLKQELGDNDNDQELEMTLENGPREVPDWNTDYLEDPSCTLDNADSDALLPPTEANNPNGLMLDKDAASINTDTGKHQCSICKKEFATVYIFRNHYKKEHLKLGYGCSVCSKTFSFLNDLKRHMKSVHMRVKYGCKKCDKTFSDPSALRRHDKSAHV